MTNFANLLAGLKGLEPEKPVLFLTEEGEVGAGYHITELKHATSTGIDCGGNVETWHEARLQILDGAGGSHMQVGKLRTILEKSLLALPQLRQAPLMVEFGHNNNRLELMSLDKPDVQDGHVLVRLNAARAACKPAQRSIDSPVASEPCCGLANDAKQMPACCRPNSATAPKAGCCN